MPDYHNVKDRFVRIRGEENINRAASLNEVEVSETKTQDGLPFLIFDNKKKNRILVFASKFGIKMLYESKIWHADGTFHTKSKYFGQLYTFH